MMAFVKTATPIVSKVVAVEVTMNLAVDVEAVGLEAVEVVTTDIARGSPSTLFYLISR